MQVLIPRQISILGKDFHSNKKHGGDKMQDMRVLNSLLEEIPGPKMIKIRQKFSKDTLDDLGVAIKQKFAKPDIGPQIRAGMRIAIKLAAVQNINELKMVRILDTLHLGEIYIRSLVTASCG